MIVTTAADLAALDVYEPVEGWETLSGFLLMRGAVPVGRRGPRPAAFPNPSAWVMRACVRDAIADWPAVIFTEPVPTPTSAGKFRWLRLHMLDDETGVAPELVELVDEAHPGGEWRRGSYPGLKLSFTVAKVVDGELVAIVAPCRARGNG